MDRRRGRCSCVGGVPGPPRARGRWRGRRGADHFPTPPDATWRDLRIRFLDGETLSVSLGGVNRVVNYTQMGFADRRNGRPAKLWQLLRTFAEGDGLLTWRSRDACRQNQKRCERLAAAPKGFFRINGAPIELTPDGKGWHSVIIVESRC